MLRVTCILGVCAIVAACAAEGQTAIAREAARSVVIPALRPAIPACLAAPVANCVVDNASGTSWWILRPRDWSRMCRGRPPSRSESCAGAMRWTVRCVKDLYDGTLRHGGCLCGAVKLRARLKAPEVQACHCAQCRRWTGGGPLYAVRVEDLEIEGADAISAYNHSEHGERAFCRICGSTLYWKLQGRSVAFIAPGLLDDQSGLRVTEEIFVDHRAEWMPPFEGASQTEEAVLMAQLEAFLAKEAKT